MAASKVTRPAGAPKIGRGRALLISGVFVLLAVACGVAFGVLARDLPTLAEGQETIDWDEPSFSGPLTMLSPEALQNRCEAHSYTDCNTPISAVCWTDDFRPDVCVATPGAPQYRLLGGVDRLARLSPDGESIILEESVRRVSDGAMLGEPLLAGATDLEWFGRTGLIRQRIDDDLIISEVDGTILDRIAIGNRGVRSMTVSSDGSMLVFQGMYGPILEVFDRGERRWRTLVDDPKYSYLGLSRPSFSEDGSLLLTSRYLVDDATPEVRQFDIVAIDVASGSVEVLQQLSTQTLFTSFSPDRTRVALYSSSWQLRVLDLDTGHISAPTWVCCAQAALTWSPNGDFMISQEGNLVIVDGEDVPYLVGPFDLRVLPNTDPWGTTFYRE